MSRRSLGLVLILGSALAGCGERGEKAAEESAPAPQAAAPAVPAQQGFWSVVGMPAGTGVTAGQLDGAVADTLSLPAKGHAQLVYPRLAVQPGDTVQASFSIAGTAGAPVSLLLMRHCDPTAGDDSSKVDVTLAATPQTVELKHAFAAAYSCIRVSVVTPQGAEVQMTRPTLAVARGAGAPTP